MVKILTSPVQGDVPFGGHKATGLSDPSAAQDAATKAYVDAVAQGLSVKASVRAASTANIASLSGLLTIDGVTLVDGDRVLAKDQTTGSTNGIWVAHSGAWTRAADADAGAELVGAFVFVGEGTTNADAGWVQTTASPITVGTTVLTWAQFSGAGQIVAGAGLAKSGNTLRRAASTTGYANLAALPSAASNNGLLVRTADGGIYESDGSAWQPVRDPSGTYESVFLVPVATGVAATDWANINAKVTAAQAVIATGGRARVVFQGCPYAGTPGSGTLTAYNIGSNTLPVVSGLAYEGVPPILYQTQGGPGMDFVFVGGTVLKGDGTAPAFAGNNTDQASMLLTFYTQFIQGAKIYGFGLDTFTYGIQVGAQNLSGFASSIIDQIYTRNCSQWGAKFVNAAQGTVIGYIQTCLCQNGVFFGANFPQGGAPPSYSPGNSTCEHLFVAIPQDGRDNRFCRGIQLETFATSGTPIINEWLFGRMQVNAFNVTPLSVTATFTNGSANIAVPDASKFAVDFIVQFTAGTSPGFTTNRNYVVRSVDTGANTITLALDRTHAVVAATGNATATLVTAGYASIDLGPRGGGVASSTWTISNCVFEQAEAEGSKVGIYAENVTSGYLRMCNVPNGSTPGVVARRCNAPAFWNLIGNPVTDFDGTSAGVWVTGTLSTRLQQNPSGTWYDNVNSVVVMSGAAPGTGHGMNVGVSATDKVGFYGATPIVQPARVAQLTDSTTGAATTTIGDVGAAFSQAGLNNIHASLLAKINALETLIHNSGLSA